MAEIRLNKYLSEAGVCSRREADKLIENGKVLVNGAPGTTGMKVQDTDTILVNGKQARLVPADDKEVYAYYKPVGVVSTMAKDEENSLYHILKDMGVEKRLFPVGRLDMDSCGLMLLTNDGELMNQILKTSNNHQKEYVVMVNKDVTDSFLKKMSEGVPITDGNTGKQVTTRRCEVRKNGKKSFVIVLRQGLNRQIRRMCGYFDYEVKMLKRIRIMNVRIDGLKEGELRKLTTEEYDKLKSLCKGNGTKNE